MLSLYELEKYELNNMVFRFTGGGNDHIVNWIQRTMLISQQNLTPLDVVVFESSSLKELLAY